MIDITNFRAVRFLDHWVGLAKPNNEVKHNCYHFVQNVTPESDSPAPEDESADVSTDTSGAESLVFQPKIRFQAPPIPCCTIIAYLHIVLGLRHLKYQKKPPEPSKPHVHVGTDGSISSPSPAELQTLTNPEPNIAGHNMGALGRIKRYFSSPNTFLLFFCSCNF